MKTRTLIIIGIVLVLVCFAVIVSFGGTYVFRKELRYEGSIEDIGITTESSEQIIRITDKRYENGVLSITLEAVSKGHDFLQISYGEEHHLEGFIVSGRGVIMRSIYMGDCTGGIIIPCAVIVFLVLLLYTLIKRVRASFRSDLYQYRNIMMFGLIVFLVFLLIMQIMSLFGYSGIINSIRNIEGSTSAFSMLTTPVFLVVSVLVTVSSINLIRKEGFSPVKMMGIVLGIIFIITPFIPDLVYWYLLSHHFDVGNLSAAPTYIEEFVGQMVHTSVAYLECMLIGTIVVAYMAAKHIPSFDKDYILILGCMIKKDGTLTNLLKGRADRAVEFAQMQKEATGKDIVFVPSGGKGGDEVISEGQAVKNYLLSLGVKEENILAECESANTYENFRNSAELIRERSGDEAKIAFSTTNYHVFRSGLLASEQDIKAEGIGSKTKRYFWVNAFVREFIAMLHSERKKHVIVLAILAVILALMVFMWYLANTIS